MNKISDESKVEYGRWHFARDVTNNFFALINSGRIFPAFAMMIIGLMAIMVFRVPEAELPALIRDFFALFRDSRGTLALLFVTSNAVWLWVYRREKRLYDREIERLVATRHELMHSSGIAHPIKKHRSSTDAQREKYILRPDDLNPHTDLNP